MIDAKDRLEATRARLRLAMVPPPEPDRPRLANNNGQSLLHKALELPGIESVAHSVGAWWSHHPLRPMAQIANEASTAAIRPLAERSPYALVLTAGAIGMALVWSRPWRWIFRSAILAGLVPRLATRIVSRLPIESWISMVSAALRRSSGPASRRAVRSTRGV